MYSRYIPAPKGETSRELSPRSLRAPAPTQPESARLGTYNRYIPSAKPAAEPKKHLHFEQEAVDTLVSEQPPTKRAKFESSPEPTIELSTKADKKQKKTKKDKKTKQSPSPEEVIAPPESPENITAADSENQPIESVNITEQKKEKKKKKKAQEPAPSDEQDGASEVDETHRRHKSVFEKKRKSMKAPDTVAEQSDGLTGEDTVMDDAPEPVEAHGLEPLPQPAPIPEDTTPPDFETLPPWLAEPIRVSRQAQAPFTDFGLSPDFGISPEVAARLAQKGYKEAFAIQTAVIPQLLPHHCRTMQSDILVSAATGSGKTLSYAVPVVRDLSHGHRHVTRLRALIVLPTRELVRQAQKVCEECAGIFSMDGKKRRVKVGTATGYQTIQEERRVLLEREDRYDPVAYQAKKKRLDSQTWGGQDDVEEKDEELIEIRRREDEKETLPDHVVDYKSKVDILICTPGRLVEHIKYTPGFSLDHVRWLIADEADKLLGQGFQQWLDIVIPRLHDEKSEARHHKQSHLTGVRKVILSATMTRDLDLLEGLRLRRPKLVVLEGSGAGVEYALPEKLQESALKADATLKPLFLLDLLQSPYLCGKESSTEQPEDTSSTLIFTKSNQSALRLSRLLGILSPQLGEVTGLLTSETAYSTRKQTLQAFTNGKIRIIVASDLVARGIDFEHLENVVNYDIPSSLASYVHRVGRTARAGRSGHAWTLFTDAEARWFWKEVASGKTVQRSGKVERIRVTEEKEAAFEVKKERYEKALQTLGDEVMEKRRGR
ncbi:ATP-dependent RNA helicase dbp6 [Neopestalotiopsis sp. 37M]|nr:ATP-dependent RNA helicase dbp6 [Neopestalotiopsis sp. 37M]